MLGIGTAAVRERDASGTATAAGATYQRKEIKLSKRKKKKTKRVMCQTNMPAYGEIESASNRVGKTDVFWPRRNTRTPSRKRCASLVLGAAKGKKRKDEGREEVRTVLFVAHDGGLED